MRDYGDDVVATIDQPPVVVGHSMDGTALQDWLSDLVGGYRPV